MRVIFPGMVEYVLKSHYAGTSKKTMFENVVEEFNYDKEYNEFKRYYARLIYRVNKKIDKIENKDAIENNINDAKDINVKEVDLKIEVLDILKNRNVIDIFDLCDELNCYPNTIKNLIHDFRNEGKEIIWKDNSIWLSRGAQAITEDVVLPTCLSDDKEIVFGVMSDTHFGSRVCQLTAINLFAEECRKSDIEHIFIAGDVLAGFGIFKGQNFELYESSSEGQEESCLVNLPTGFKYWAIGGNHDYSFMKIAGHNVIRSLARQRDDITYCGFDWAEIEILKNVSIGLWHPSGGVPYSISYRLQKGVEQMAFEELTKIVEGKKERPSLRFLCAGHLHIQMQALFGSVLGMQCGCFEGAGSYLKAKKLVPAIGGYIVHAKLGKNGLLKDYSTKFHLYPEIEDDWKNYNHHIKHDEIIKPIF